MSVTHATSSLPSLLSLPCRLTAPVDLLLLPRVRSSTLAQDAFAELVMDPDFLFDWPVSFVSSPSKYENYRGQSKKFSNRLPFFLSASQYKSTPLYVSGVWKTVPSFSSPSSSWCLQILFSINNSFIIFFLSSSSVLSLLKLFHSLLSSVLWLFSSFKTEHNRRTILAVCWFANITESDRVPQSFRTKRTPFWDERSQTRYGGKFSVSGNDDFTLGFLQTGGTLQQPEKLRKSHSKLALI